MHKKDLFSSLFFVMLSIYVSGYSLNLGFGSFSKPGPGFLPLLVGFSLGIFSLLIFVRGLLRREDSEKAQIRDLPWRPLLLTFGSLVGFSVLLTTLGFAIDTFLLILLLLRVVGKKGWVTAIVASVIGTLCIYSVFGCLLQLQLPAGFLGF